MPSSGFVTGRCLSDKPSVKAGILRYRVYAIVSKSSVNVTGNQIVCREMACFSPAAKSVREQGIHSSTIVILNGLKS